MANPEHLATLKQGVKQWNEWRQEHPGERPNLIRADLRQASLAGVNLRWAGLREAVLRRVNLIDADLREADR